MRPVPWTALLIRSLAIDRHPLMSQLAHYLAALAPRLPRPRSLSARLPTRRAGSLEPAGERGEAIAIRPGHQRATVTGADGTSRPLWDGVHRLETDAP